MKAPLAESSVQKRESYSPSASSVDSRCCSQENILCTRSVELYADCSVCSDGYIGDGDNTCRACSSNSRAQLAVIIVFSVVGVAIAIFFALYLLSGIMESVCWDVARIVARHLPSQSIKIIIVTWQILTQVRKKLKCTILFRSRIPCMSLRSACW